VVSSHYSDVQLEMRVLRGIFKPKGEEVAGCWSRLHSKELYNLHVSPNIISIMKLRMRLAGYVAHIGKMRNAYKILVRKCGSGSTWEDNIRLDPKKKSEKI